MEKTAYWFRLVTRVLSLQVFAAEFCKIVQREGSTLASNSNNFHKSSRNSREHNEGESVIIPKSRKVVFG